MVECEECGKDVTSFYELEGRKLCLGCYSDLEDKDKKKNKTEASTDIPKKLEFKTRPTHLGTILRICGILGTIICFIAGLNMITIQAEISTIMLAYYNSMGIFVIGLSIVICPILWGFAYFIDKK
jgi:hypothetical protein